MHSSTPDTHPPVSVLLPRPGLSLLSSAPALRLVSQLPAHYLHKDAPADNPGGESLLVIRQPLAFPELLVQLAVGVFEQEAERAPDDVRDVLAADQEEGQQHQGNQQLGQESPHRASARAAARVPTAHGPAMLSGWDGQSPRGSGRSSTAGLQPAQHSAVTLAAAAPLVAGSQQRVGRWGVLCLTASVKVTGPGL